MTSSSKRFSKSSDDQPLLRFYQIEDYSDYPQRNLRSECPYGNTFNCITIRERITPVVGVHIDNTCSAKDVATEAKLLHALHALARRLAIVVAVHRLSTIAGCDKMVDLRNKSAIVAEAAT